MLLSIIPCAGRRICLIIAAILVLYSTITFGSSPQGVVTWYGTLWLRLPEDALLLDLLQSPAFKRLEKINQYGVIQLVDTEGINSEKYTRYDHSLGVLFLLREFQAPLKEQASGLIHDLSHTVFSHVADYYFSNGDKGSAYHDSVFVHFLKKYDIETILRRYNFSPEDMQPDAALYPQLECDLPDICADRLDYILQGAERRNLLTRAQVSQILASLGWDRTDRRWYLTDAASALLIADASLALNRSVFATAWGRMLYKWTADVMSHMVNIGELDVEDILFRMGDRTMWDKILTSRNPTIQSLASKMKAAPLIVQAASNDQSISNGQTEHKFQNIRCRVIDPPVLIDKKYKRLSEINAFFKEKYQQEQERCKTLRAVIHPVPEKADQNTALR